MKSSDFSAQFPELWASSATSDTITYPIPATTTTNGRAALGTGFTTTNMTPLAAGGIPPYGQDFNGILKMLSTSAQNYESGNVPVWSSAMASDISGYPQYALVQYEGTYYVSTADGNITTPGATDASWKSLFDGYATVSYVSGNYVPTSTTTSGDTDLKVRGAYYSVIVSAPYLASYDSSGNDVNYILATQEWVKSLGYTTLASVAGVGYVSGVATSSNFGITNIQLVNYTGTDQSSTYMEVSTTAGAIAIPSQTNVAAQIVAYAQPIGSYVTAGTYSSDFDSADSRVQFLAYGKMLQFENIAAVNSGTRITFPRAFSAVPVVVPCPVTAADQNCHPYSVDESGFYIYRNAGGSIQFNYFAIGLK